jgi:hypothetical protein
MTPTVIIQELSVVSSPLSVVKGREQAMRRKRDYAGRGGVTQKATDDNVKMRRAS